MKLGIERGLLEVKAGTGKGEKRAYEITLLDEGDLPKIMALQDLIVSHLNCSSLMEPFSSDFMRRHLGQQGFVQGVFCEGTLVAFRNVYFPDVHDAEWNLGWDIGLPHRQLHRVANLQMVCVHPAYRGNGLGMIMNRNALRILRMLGRYHHICATVSPFNFWNIRILLASGFHIRALKPKYSGKLRYIVYQPLKDPVKFRNNIVTNVPLGALPDQQALLSAGHCGVDLVPSGKGGGNKDWRSEHWELVFRRPVQALKVKVGSSRSAGRKADDRRTPLDYPEMNSVPLKSGERDDPSDDER